MDKLKINSLLVSGLQSKLASKRFISNIEKHSSELYGSYGHPYAGRAIIPMTDEQRIYYRKFDQYMKEHPDIDISDIDSSEVDKIILDDDTLDTGKNIFNFLKNIFLSFWGAD